MKKNIIITGSTDGIGKLAALMLAKDGHNVYVHGRNEKKVAATVAEIIATTKNEDIHGLIADLSDMESVRNMAHHIKSKLSQIDVLINNAGIYNSPQASNKDGIEMRMAVNYLAPYLLTYELLPLLENSPSARIINLSSAAQAPVSPDALNAGYRTSEGSAYAQSKLALAMWSIYLAEKLETTAVIALNPGSLLNTKMVKEAFGHHYSSADKGANIIYDLAVSKDHEGISGKYFDNDRGMYGQLISDAYNPDKVEALIKQTEKYFKK